MAKIFHSEIANQPTWDWIESNYQNYGYKAFPLTNFEQQFFAENELIFEIPQHCFIQLSDFCNRK